MANFSLLQSPFAILGIGPRATREQAAERALEVATQEASAASRSLITPRTRIEAEVNFLPGADAETVGRILSELTAGAAPDGWDLSLPARANLYGHLLTMQPPTSNRLREFILIRSRLADEEFEAAIAEDHRTAGIPPPPAELLRRALEALAETHAAIAADAAAGLGEAQGGLLLVQLISQTEPDDPQRTQFLRRVSFAWTRSTSGRLAALEEEATKQEFVLRDKAEPTAAAALAGIVQDWAELTAPAREVDTIAGLTHRASADAALRWRGITLRLVDEHKSATVALPVAEALAERFGRLPGLGGKLREDVETCRELAETEKTANHPAVVALAAAIEGVRARADIVAATLDGSSTVSGRGPAVASLVDTFRAALRADLGSLPWQLVRQLALWLHNERGFTAAALSLSRLMAEAAQESANHKMSPAELADLRASLNADIRTLARVLATKKLEVALGKEQHSEALELAAELVSLTDSAEERRAAEGIRDRLSEQLSKRTRTRVIWGLVAAAAIGFVLLQENNSPPRSPASYQPAPVASPGPTPPPARPTPVEQATVPPSTTGSALLTLSELRWCQFQDRRLHAAEALIRSARVSNGYAARDVDAAIGQLNRLSDQFNTACMGRRYLERDLQQIQGEARARADELFQEGQRLISLSPTTRALPASSAQPAPAPGQASQVGPSGATPAQDALADRAMARAVQERLNLLGFSPGPADGVFGARSRAALREFKRSRGLPDNDAFDAATQRALNL